MRVLLLMLLALQTAAPPVFEVASVKQVTNDVLRLRKAGIGCAMPSPGRVSCMSNLRILIAQVNDMPLATSSQDIVGLPTWGEDDVYDIEAVLPREHLEPFKAGPVYAMVRALLADRFKLVTHRERKEVPSYALVMARTDRKLGPQLQPTPNACADWIGSGRHGEPPMIFGDLPCGRGEMRGTIWRQSRVPLTQLANLLGGRVERPVEDRTGLTGMYAFDLRWAASAPANPLNDGVPSATVPDNLPTSIFTAIQEQLGLKLEPTKTMADFLVIDHVERPTAN